MVILQISTTKVHEIAARFFTENPEKYRSVMQAFTDITGKQYAWNDGKIREIEFETEEEMIAFKLTWL